MEFLRSFLRRHFVGKPVVSSRNVGCFVRLVRLLSCFSDSISCVTEVKTTFIINMGALKSLKWLNVRDKLLFNDLVMVYKCLKNLTPGYLHGRFQYRAKTHQRVTRQNNDLTLPRYRLATGQKTFTYRGAKLYNSIAKDIRDTGNLNAFKKRIFKFLLNS